MQKIFLNLFILALIILLPSACNGTPETPLKSTDIEGTYISFGDPYSEGEAHVVANYDGKGEEKVNITVNSFSPYRGTTCFWEGTVSVSRKPIVIKEPGWNEAITLQFQQDSFEIKGASSELCGNGGSFDATFLKVGSPTYNEARKPVLSIPAFEGVQVGNVIAYEVKNDQYKLEIDQVGESFTISGKITDPIFKGIEHTMKWAKIYGPQTLPENPTVAILQDETSNCAFVELRAEQLFIRDYKLTPKKLIVDVCIAETDNCFSTRISQTNPIFYEVQDWLGARKGDTVEAIFSSNGEIFAMQDSSQLSGVHGTWNINIDETINASPELKIQSDSNPMAKDMLKSMLGDFTIRIDMQRFMLSGKLAGKYLGDQKFAVSKQEGSRMVITADDGVSMDMRLIDAQTLEIKDPQQGMLLIFKKSL